MFKCEASTFVRTMSVALSVGFAITGLTGLGALSIGNAQICYDDFIGYCRPIEPPGFALISLAVEAMIAFLIFVKVNNSSKKAS